MKSLFKTSLLCLGIFTVTLLIQVPNGVSSDKKEIYFQILLKRPENPYLKNKVFSLYARENKTQILKKN